MNRNRSLLTLELDAVTADCINKTDTPFLYALKEKYGIKRLQTNLSYLEPYEAFTGKIPRETGSWCVFVKKDRGSFSWLRYFPISIFENTLLRSLIIFKINWITNFLRYVQGKLFFGTVKYTPLKLIPEFDFTLDKMVFQENAVKVRTIFDYFREKGIKFFYCSLPVVYNGKKNLEFNFADDHLLKVIRKNKKDFQFYHLYISAVDSLTHKFGYKSKEVKKKLREVDNLAKNLIEELNEHYKLDFMIFSFHGMIPVKGSLNVIELLKKEGLKKNKDYTAFLDLTAARFWFKNNSTREKVSRALGNIKQGRILDEGLAKKLGVFVSKEIGDMVFLLNPGYILLPNYFQKGNIKAMHVYEPVRGLDGMIISSFSSNNMEKISSICDIYSMILEYYQTYFKG